MNVLEYQADRCMVRVSAEWVWYDEALNRRKSNSRNTPVTILYVYRVVILHFHTTIIAIQHE